MWFGRVILSIKDGLTHRLTSTAVCGASMNLCSGIRLITSRMKAPNVDAYLINGMSNYRRPSDGLAQRPVHHTEALESRLGRPVIGHDTALYWRVFKTLGITPEIAHGQLLSSLGGNS